MALTIVGPVSVPPLAPGGIRYAAAVSTTGVVKAAPGILNKIVCISAGSITVNDTATTGGNVVWNGSLTEGQVVDLDWPCAAGIAVSAVSGSVNISFT